MLPLSHKCDDNCNREDENHVKLSQSLRERKLTQVHQEADQAWAKFRDMASELVDVRTKITDNPNSLNQHDFDIAAAAISMVLGEVYLRMATTASWDC